MSINRFRVGQREEKGGILVLVSVGMVAFFGFAALSIDVARIYQQQRDMQSATDAGALAAAALLPTATQEGPVITEGANLAQANGITTNEITLSNYGTVQVGQWDSTSQKFTRDAKPYNAVLVPAKRDTTLSFGQVVGFRKMSQTIYSIAEWVGLGSVSADMATNLVPFGVTTDQLAAATSSGIFDYSGSISPGNRGKVDLCGDNDSSHGVFTGDMTYGVKCAVSIGDTPTSGTGNAAFPSAFNARLLVNPFVIIPVVDSFSNGKKTLTIEGFIAGELIPNTPGDPSSGWSGKIQLSNNVIGGTGSGGGSTNAPYAQARMLVQ